MPGPRHCPQPTPRHRESDTEVHYGHADAADQPAGRGLTIPSSTRRLRVSAIVKATGVDHPVSPCSWLRYHALRRVQLNPGREGSGAALPARWGSGRSHQGDAAVVQQRTLFGGKANFTVITPVGRPCATAAAMTDRDVRSRGGGRGKRKLLLAIVDRFWDSFINEFRSVPRRRCRSTIMEGCDGKAHARGPTRP